MKIIQCEIPPKEYRYGDAESLGEYDIERARASGADTLIYWYAAGSYEGSGEALMRKDRKWIYLNLSHCSCYGPITGTPDFRDAQPLAQLLGRMSDDLKADLAPLIKRARRFS